VDSRPSALPRQYLVDGGGPTRFGVRAGPPPAGGRQEHHAADKRGERPGSVPCGTTVSRSDDLR
jgi:hypothetical protein